MLTVFVIIEGRGSWSGCMSIAEQARRFPVIWPSLSAAKLITLRDYEHSNATECETCERPGLPGRLRQQCADAGEHLGLLSGVRNPATADRSPGGNPQLSGHLSESATGQGV